MQQFLQSLAAMGGSLTPQSQPSLSPPQPPQEIAPSTTSTPTIAATTEGEKDKEIEDEEEVIPDL